MSLFLHFFRIESRYNFTSSFNLNSKYFSIRTFKFQFHFFVYKLKIIMSFNFLKVCVCVCVCVFCGEKFLFIFLFIFNSVSRWNQIKLYTFLHVDFPRSLTCTYLYVPVYTCINLNVPKTCLNDSISFHLQETKLINSTYYEFIDIFQNNFDFFLNVIIQSF